MLKIGENVGRGYKVQSMPFKSKEEAEEWIEKYWKTTYAEAYQSKKDGKWYIIC